jgi:hypothetical protein
LIRRKSEGTTEQARMTSEIRHGPIKSGAFGMATAIAIGARSGMGMQAP